MKKLMLSIMALMAVTASSVFGMYDADSDWVDFLTHGNQLRARVNQFGFTLGNGTIKGTFGFKGNNIIFNSNPEYPNASEHGRFQFNPTVSAGLGYTSEAISAGVGYSFTYNDKYLSTHTPVLMLNFLNNNLRIVVPVSVAMGNKDPHSSTTKNYKYTGISTDTHIRYYTGLESFSQLRLYVKYGMNQTEYEMESVKHKESASSLGIDFRAYFGANVDNLALSPFIKVTYDTSLGAKGKMGSTSYSIKASDRTSLYTPQSGQEASYERETYRLRVLPALGMTASSDIVSIYVEPSLGYEVYDDGQKGSKLKHGLAWNAYGELYVTPLPNLEWYVEAEIQGASTPVTSGNPQTFGFNSSTGITWYLPSLQE